MQTEIRKSWSIKIFSFTEIIKIVFHQNTTELQSYNDFERYGIKFRGEANALSSLKKNLNLFRILYVLMYNAKPLLEGRNTPYSAYIRACIICTVVLLSLESMQRYLWESLSLTIIIMGSKKYKYMDISCERVFEDSFMFTI